MRQRMRQGRTKPVGNEFSDLVKDNVKIRAQFTCEFPDCPRMISHFHHILRRSQGGPGTEGNCMALCTKCHDYIHANPKESFERGWLRHPPARG